MVDDVCLDVVGTVSLLYDIFGGALRGLSYLVDNNGGTLGRAACSDGSVCGGRVIRCMIPAISRSASCVWLSILSEGLWW